MNAEISETIRARLLGFGMQIPELLTQRKLVSAGCQKLPKIVNMNADISETIKNIELGFSDLDFVALYTAQVCNTNMPRPL